MEDSFASISCTQVFLHSEIFRCFIPVCLFVFVTLYFHLPSPSPQLCGLRVNKLLKKRDMIESLPPTGFIQISSKRRAKKAMKEKEKGRFLIGERLSGGRERGRGKKKETPRYISSGEEWGFRGKCPRRCFHPCLDYLVISRSW